jgi:hypothetical protein
MEELRFLPVLMFITGVVLVYAGFTNQTPLSIIRGQLGHLSSGTPSPNSTTTPFTPNGSSDYAGVAYSRPSMSTGPRLYS